MVEDACPAQRCFPGLVLGGVQPQGLEQAQRVGSHAQVPFDEVVDRGFQGPGRAQAQRDAEVSGLERGVVRHVDAGTARHRGEYAAYRLRPAGWHRCGPVTRKAGSGTARLRAPAVAFGLSCSW